jgi:putative peptidoglycan lipid II flippase
VTERPARLTGSTLVAAGILASRLSGVVRDAVVNAVFGVGPHLDVFRTALRAPNILQNLLGEGTLSASFIPIYSRLLAEGRRGDAGRFAGAICGLLIATAGAVALLGVLLARPLVTLLTPGYLADAAAVAAGEATVDRLPLAIAAVRYVFPMTGLLVLSAWALGVLNSHRRFFLPYVAPVVWNAAIVAALVFAGGLTGGLGGGGLDRLLFAACLGALVGGGLQLLVQLPLVVREMTGFRLSLDTRAAGVREALAAFAPVVTGRGVAQLGAYVDLLLASYLAAGALGALGSAQTLYLLPISLFGMSVAAAELPELARAGRAEGGEICRRATAGLARMAFFTIPTVVGYLAFGYLVVGGLFARGRFGLADTWLVYLTLAAYALGVLPSTSARMLQNVCYALGEQRTTARIGIARTLLAGALGAAMMLVLDQVPLTAFTGPLSGGGDRGLRLGAAGLALGSGVAAWLEVALLVRAVRRHLPAFELPWAIAGRRLAAAAASAVAAGLVWWLTATSFRLPLLVSAILVLGVFGVGYLGRQLPALLRGRGPQT